MPSFFYPELDSSHSKVLLVAEEYHHLVHVLRHKIADTITINSGNGWQGTGIIVNITKSQVEIEVTSVEYFKKDYLDYAIAFSLLRSKNDEWLAEKVTELGVTDLFPFTSQFSVRNPAKNTLARLQLTALNAIKQCDNPWLPTVNEIRPLRQSIQAIENKGYIPVIASEYRPQASLDSLAKEQKYCFIIGPEGGFSPEEFDFFQTKEFREISISKLILRAETAAIAIAAQYSLLHRLLYKPI